MKLDLLTLVLGLICSTTYAQTPPQVMNYQALARDNQGNPVVNQAIGFEISLVSGSPTGTVAYTETQIDTSDANGVVNLKIGQGTPSTGTFSSINWGAANHWLQISMDITGGTNYLAIGTTQLMSVPYAFYAASSGTSGVTGMQGATGATGAMGMNGLPGVTGATGAMGPTGVMGPTGTFNLPGSADQTMSHDGMEWTASSVLTNDETSVSINTTSGALILPRLTTVQRDAIASPVTGMLIFNTTLITFQGYDGTSWVNL